MPASKRPVRVMVRGDHTVKTSVPAEVTRLKARGYHEQARAKDTAPANVRGGSDKPETTEAKAPDVKTAKQ